MVAAQGVGTVARAVESRDPVTGEVWRTFTAATPEAVRHAVILARAAQREWAGQTLRERRGVMERFRRLLVERRGAAIELIQRETGKPRVEALVEVLAVLNFAAFYGKAARRVLKTHSYRAGTVAMMRKTVRVAREAYGVIGLITPWNYPFLMPAGIAIPALLAGNAVLLKPSEFTPSVSLLLGELLREAGLPEGVLTVLPGDGTTGAALTAEKLDKVFFIGSEATGRKIALSCAERMTPCVLELGGSDPAIVLEDADLDVAALGIAWGRFFNAGQTCVAPKRVFVVEKVYDAFVKKLAERVSGLRAGTGEVDSGPMIRASQAGALREQYEDAMERGASVSARATVNAPENPCVFAPTVLLNVPAEARALTEETFGPLLPVVRVRDEQEAIARANDSRYGLSASVWSRDIARAEAVGRNLECGSVMINDCVFAAGMADVPYGGVKASGMGRSHGIAGLLECVQEKTYVIDPWAGWRQAYWYSYGPKIAAGLENYLTFEHGRGILGRLVAGTRAVWALYFGRD